MAPTTGIEKRKSEQEILIFLVQNGWVPEMFYGAFSGKVSKFFDRRKETFSLKEAWRIQIGLNQGLDLNEILSAI
jgi:hypothetical protein